MRFDLHRSTVRDSGSVRAKPTRHHTLPRSSSPSQCFGSDSVNPAAARAVVSWCERPGPQLCPAMTRQRNRGGCISAPADGTAETTRPHISTFFFPSAELAVYLVLPKEAYLFGRHVVVGSGGCVRNRGSCLCNSLGRRDKMV